MSHMNLAAIKIMAERGRRKLTIDQLASLAGVNAETVKRIENGGNFQAGTMAQLSKALDLDLEELLAAAHVHVGNGDNGPDRPSVLDQSKPSGASSAAKQSDASAA